MQLIIDKKEIINNYLNNYEMKYNKHGKAYIYDDTFYFNKSHTKDLSVLLIDEKECGIDIEYLRKYNEVMAKKIFSSEENNYINKRKNKDYLFTLLWTLKESYLKFLGTGINTDLKNVSFVKNNKIIFKKDNCKFKVVKIQNYIISICRKDFI